MSNEAYCKEKVREWIHHISIREAYPVLSIMFAFIFPRPMDKADLLQKLVNYGLENEVYLLRGRTGEKGGVLLFQFIPDTVMAQIDPDSKDTYLKLQRLRRKHFVQKLRRVEVNGIPGIRMSLNWKLIYERLSGEYEKVLARRKAYEQRRKEAGERAA